jgi:hypothetical protein
MLLASHHNLLLLGIRSAVHNRPRLPLRKYGELKLEIESKIRNDKNELRRLQHSQSFSE